MFKNIHKIICIAFLSVLCLQANAQIKFGFILPKGYDNFNNSDTSAYIELAVFNDNQDTLKYVTGADVYPINGTAINGVHYDMKSQTVNFKPGTPGYANYKKVKLNLIPDSFFYGTRFFTLGLRNITGVLKSQLNFGLDTLKIIIDYDGLKIGYPTLSIADYKLYPNPTRDALYIEGVESKNYVIFNGMGQEIFSGETANNKIDVSSLKEGLYILKSVTDKGMLIQKFFKQ